MKSSTALALLSTGAARVLAAPFLEARQDSNEFIWENEDGVGNAQASIGDGLMSFGNIVPSTTLQQIDEHCTLTGCTPGEELSVPAVVVNSNYGNDVEIKMTVEGSFNAAGDRGSKAQLLDLAKKAMEELFNKGIATWEQDVKYLEDRCPGFQTNCNPDGAKYADQWKSTNHVSVRVNNDDDGGLAGFLNVGFSYGDAEGGVCGALTAAGVGLGLANAFSGAGLVLLGVACAEI
ncbi:uncharacterized protein F5Z01DRAFT_752839 [Emericellopsis atlantica]|uniref:Uncharacterized protein n=1 Tax=Emericellopsis atlantica TaxID=2614577 RepID=A0A9P8CLB2_9HYPO|nr:uncharacterized protein F5Z01DRAFT_752839 [Emericellopsis atlantica]KAG9251429.1 hypothetical protein F5Z01DRAFT_752839 [Emericellopsis atlantica]